MAVKVVPKFSVVEIKRAMARKLALIEEAIVLRLTRTGERFVKNARNVNTYKDQTGNLRSSIGYVVLKNGEQVSENFKAGKGKEGVDKAKALVAELVDKYPRGYVLICVAGMDYAAAVESKGYDVITGSSKIAEQELKKAMKELSDKLGKGK
jgi:hypothetical protein